MRLRFFHLTIRGLPVLVGEGRGGGQFAPMAAALGFPPRPVTRSCMAVCTGPPLFGTFWDCVSATAKGACVLSRL